MGFINDLQADIDTLGWALDVQFLGINDYLGFPGAHCGPVSSRTGIPWLQEIQDRVVDKWGVNLRDIIVLDENNVQVAVFPDRLDVPANYDSLKTLLGSLAQGGE